MIFESKFKNKQSEEKNIINNIFIPHQPYLEYNSKYHSYKPDKKDKLYGRVWEVYQVDNFDFNRIIAFPDFCADLMVFYCDDMARCYIMEGTRKIRLMNEMEFISNVHTIFGIKFYSGELESIFNSDLHDLGENIVDADYAMVNGREVIEKLLEAKSFDGRWTLLRKYIEKRLECEYIQDALTKYVVKSILNSHGKIKVKNLEEETGYTERYIRKKISEKIGVSVKTFSEIVQFQWSYHLFHDKGRNISLSDLALESGYYDQSHMNLSYKRLTGNLPKNIMNLYVQ